MRVWSRRAGISLLLEVMVGFGLVAISLLMIFTIFPTSYQTMAVAKDRSIAINVARELLEERRIKGWLDPGNEASATPYTLGSVIGVCLANGNRSETEFFRTYTVTQVDPQRRRVLVNVSWTVGAAGGTSGMERSVVLETYVTPH